MRPPNSGPRATGRALLFAGLCAVSVLVAVGYTALAAARTPRIPNAGAVVATPSGPRPAAPAAPDALLYVRTDGGMWEGVARSPLPAVDGQPQLMGLQCQRVHFAAGQGLCVRDDALRGGAFLFDADFKVRTRLPANGIVSRARVAPDGRHAAMTLFVQGHSYSDGTFSTQTTVIDTVAGAAIGDLEQFAIVGDGAPPRRDDANFWGVTFAHDGDRFYATMATGKQTYLVQGSLASREMRVLRENVECPSLSPDETRIVFKKRMNPPSDARAVWRLHLLDLATMAERPLDETRNVDDQAEWLDNDDVLYSLRDEGPPATIRPDIWSVPVDGGAPRRLLTNALSPAVLR